MNKLIECTKAQQDHGEAQGCLFCAALMIWAWLAVNNAMTLDHNLCAQNQVKTRASCHGHL
eukprot:6485161-Amphidinium_carterae.1